MLILMPVLLLSSKVPVTAEEQEETMIAMLVEEHVNNPDTIVSSLSVPLSPQQGQTDCNPEMHHNSLWRIH